MVGLPFLRTWTFKPVSSERISFATSPLIPTYSGQGPSKFLTLYRIFKHQMLYFYFYVITLRKNHKTHRSGWFVFKSSFMCLVIQLLLVLEPLPNPAGSGCIKKTINEIHLYATNIFIPRNNLTRKSIVSIFGGSPQCAGNSIFCENTAVAKIVSSEIMNRLLIILFIGGLVV